MKIMRFVLVAGFVVLGQMAQGMNFTLNDKVGEDSLDFILSQPSSVPADQELLARAVQSLDHATRPATKVEREAVVKAELLALNEALNNTLLLQQQREKLDQVGQGEKEWDRTVRAAEFASLSRTVVKLEAELFNLHGTLEVQATQLRCAQEEIVLLKAELQKEKKAKMNSHVAKEIACSDSAIDVTD